MNRTLRSLLAVLVALAGHAGCALDAGSDGPPQPGRWTSDSVEFFVGPDSLSLTGPSFSYAVAGVPPPPYDTCWVSGTHYFYGADGLRIDGSQFTYVDQDVLVVGEFSSSAEASGTIELLHPGDCTPETSPLSWTALPATVP